MSAGEHLKTAAEHNIVPSRNDIFLVVALITLFIAGCFRGSFIYDDLLSLENKHTVNWFSPLAKLSSQKSKIIVVLKYTLSTLEACSK